MLGMPSDATVLLNSWNFLQIFQITGVTHLNFVLQSFSLFLFAGFLFFGVKTFKLIIKEKVYLRIATLLFVFMARRHYELNKNKQ